MKPGNGVALHGGNSLQERVVPVLTVTHRKEAGGSTLQFPEAFDRVGPDGVEHRAEQIHAIALSDLHGEFATVVDTGAVIAALQVSPSSRSAS